MGESRDGVDASSGSSVSRRREHWARGPRGSCGEEDGEENRSSAACRLGIELLAMGESRMFGASAQGCFAATCAVSEGCSACRWRWAAGCRAPCSGWFRGCRCVTRGSDGLRDEAAHGSALLPPRLVGMCSAMACQVVAICEEGVLAVECLSEGRLRDLRALPVRFSSATGASKEVSGSAADSWSLGALARRPMWPLSLSGSHIGWDELKNEWLRLLQALLLPLLSSLSLQLSR
mmetsp:Transcript_8518/g.21513  ORF Transcript_8518/g.21513 Transcript_8518/m.21513 type:complete len:234 (+) Transcript_8518:1481-2182(+)